MIILIRDIVIMEKLYIILNLIRLLDFLNLEIINYLLNFLI